MEEEGKGKRRWGKKRRRMWNDEEISGRGLEKDSRVKRKQEEKVAGRCSCRGRKEKKEEE